MNTLDVSNHPKVRKFVPTPAQAAERTAARRTSDWLWQLPPEQLGQYAGQWIAAFDCQIVASAETREELAHKVAHLDRSLVIEQRIENRRMIRA